VKTILLHGRLASAIGPEHRFDVASPLEAVRAILSQFPASREILRHSNWRVTVDGDERDIELCRMLGGQVYSFEPVIAGAGGRGGGLALIVIGAALVTAAVVFTGGAGAVAMSPWSAAAANAAAAGGWAAAASSAATNIGLGLIFTGAATLLTPVPKTPKQQGSRQNYVGTSGNTTVAGVPIPLVYGRMKVGSVCISTSLHTEKLPANYKSKVT